jgi:hypothetical protein
MSNSTETTTPTAPLGGQDRPEPVSAQDQAESFLDKAMGIVSDLLEVKVVTAVGNAQVTITTVNDSTTTTIGTSEPLKSTIVTIVKLADGDVSTIISDDLLANTELRAFHTDQVEKSLKVLPDNLRALVDIAKTLRELTN